MGPNPWKVVILLEALSLPYKTTYVEMVDMKKEPLISKSINGRVPVIEDPNTGITIWESGAILEYLIETYDKDSKYTYTSSPEKWELKQWLHFQMSGQGPYFGQGAWFSHFNPEKIPAAIERYHNEVRRVMTVLDTHLAGKEWMVGDKVTYVDFAFVPWQDLVPFITGKDMETSMEGLPNLQAWWKRINEVPAVKKALDEKHSS